MSKLELIEFIALAAIVFVGLIVLLVLAIKNGWIKKLTKTLNEEIVITDVQEIKSEHTVKYLAISDDKFIEALHNNKNIKYLVANS